MIANLYPTTIDVNIMVDLSNLDKDEPDHSAHNLIEYIVLPGYSKRDSYWWRKLYRKVTVRTGSQAQRVVRHALTKIDDAIYQALITRDARRQHLTGILS